jgi:signal transduction histidine kinase
MGRINRINALADRVADGRSGRAPARTAHPDEFGLLETHVHAMLDRIENLNRATHRLSDTIAHELRTPLNRMLQKLSRIEGQDDLTATLKGRDAPGDPHVRQPARHQPGRGGSGHRRRARAGRPVRGGAEVWELYEPLAEDKGLIPTLTIAPGLQILGDRNLIAQVLSNLLDNAIKYCAPGDRLTPSTSPPNRRAAMRVADTGPGLARRPQGRGLRPLHPRRARPPAASRATGLAWPWSAPSPPAMARGCPCPGPTAA